MVPLNLEATEAYLLLHKCIGSEFTHHRFMTARGTLKRLWATPTVARTRGRVVQVPRLSSHCGDEDGEAEREPAEGEGDTGPRI